MLAQLAVPMGLAYATAVVVAIALEAARSRSLRITLGAAPRILRYAAVTVGVLAAALWLYAAAGLVRLPDLRLPGLPG